ncbi:anti-sigma factor [Cytobacillus dafuensis]|uniref:Anti-sigma factor n=1 Tax=Cytobacillus dafuensis TaxID=1742359 RepID=A0A5B8Z4V8_CYTDA|nr:anti-sigma factor [Cytobacillus dafuensis]QED47897.1 anti-sigma factor [Cytobacillus dafuensis]
MKDQHNQEDEEIYKSFISESIHNLEQSNNISEEEQIKLIKNGKNRAFKTNIMVSLAVLLLIVPVMTLSTFLYYGIGGKANKQIEVATKTIYITEPNMSLEEMELEEEIGFFSMDIYFDIYKKIGKEDYKAGDYKVHYVLDKPGFPERNMQTERPLKEIASMETDHLIHPDALVPPGFDHQWDILKGLPDGTVGEVYLSLNKVMDPDELEKQLGNEVEVRWVAVDTGMESKQLDKEGLPISPIGFPLQIDQTTWSPFNGREQTNEEVFIDTLEFLQKNEESAEKIARAKSLSLNERIPYIKENGVQVYGAVVTGPIPELRKLEQNELIRAMKVGEVKLWNWK